MKFPVIEFPSDFFMWAGHQFIAEASDMNNRHLQRLYPDAMDVGFAVKSSKTGKVVTYVMDDIKRDEEGEIFYWRYTPDNQSQHKIPACIGTTAIIFNS